MAAYTYKEVCHRADFTAMDKQFEGKYGREIDPDPNYDGDYWTVAADLLDAKDARIASLEALLGEAPHSELCDSMASGWVAGLEVAPGDLDCNCFKSRA